MQSVRCLADWTRRSVLLTSLAGYGVGLSPEAMQAQRGFASRDQFFAADSATVRLKLGATPLADSIALDSVVRAAIPIVSAFFKLSADVFWADGQGSSAHPTAGIALDRSRLGSMREEMEATEFSNVVLFILGHEFAHMGQFRHYPLSRLRTSDRRRLFECQADLWAGVMTMHVITDSSPKATPDTSQKGLEQDFFRIEQAAALAYQIGTPSWEELSEHPPPLMREECVVRGLEGGLVLRWIHYYDESHAASWASLIAAARSKDPRLPGPSSDEWALTEAEATAIVDSRSRTASSQRDALDRVVASIDSGMNGFVNEAAKGLPFVHCSTTGDRTAISMTCKDSIPFSPRMQVDEYNRLREMARTVTIPRGWSEQSEQLLDAGRWTGTSFLSPDRRTSLTIHYRKVANRRRDVFLTMTVKSRI